MNERSAEGVVGLWSAIASAIRLFQFCFSVFFVLFFKVTFEARKQVTKHKFKTIMLFLAA